MRPCGPESPPPLADEPLWKADLDRTIPIAPIVVGDTVYVATITGVVALDTLTGSPRWERHRVVDVQIASMAANRSYVAVASEHRVVVLETSTGEMAWQHSSVFGFPESLVMDQNTLYAGFAFEEVVAYDLASGDLLWRSKEPRQMHNIPHLCRTDNTLS